MPLDGFTISLLCNELRMKIIGSKIEKIYMPTNEEIVFSLRSRTVSENLVFGTSPSMPRMYLTQDKSENPQSPPMFCMFMRKHLLGCIITDIAQDGLDRTVFFDLSGYNEIGDKVKFKIAFEIMNKHCNFTIINEEGIIFETLKKSDFSPKSNRALLPGFKYLLPPKQEKLNISNCKIDDIVATIGEKQNKMLSEAILSALEGASTLISREIAYLATGNDLPVSSLNESQYKRLFEILTNLRSILGSQAEPCILVDKEGKPVDITFTNIAQYGYSIDCVKKSSYSDLIESFYSHKTNINKNNQQSKNLHKIVSNLVSRSRRKLETRKNELLKCKDKNKYRIFAELILANQYSLVKGSLYYDLLNYYDENKIVRINASPALSPSENAQKYFKEYNKLRNAEKFLIDLLNENEMELNYLEGVLDSIQRSTGYTEIEEIIQELEEQGYLKRKRKNKKNLKKVKKIEPLEYISDDGYLILCGKNNFQNEQISFRIGAKDDSWFHVQGFHGAHVVVIGNGDIISELTCRQAAIIAACNSEANGSSQVPVDYTVIKELKRPPNAKPGMVIYHSYNTMWVTPDKELCERLRKK